MENATQALLIAAGVLVGIIILSLAIHLGYTFGGFAKSTQGKIDENQVAQFNDKFMKYSGLKDLTIQDVISVKNYALENNKQDANYNPSPSATAFRAANNNDYIDVYYADAKAVAYSLSALVLDKKDEDLLKTEMEKINSGKKSNRFTCEVKINPQTGRVNKIYFYET